ncbi:MAG: 50S ribosomal protein L15 [Bacteroidetes bacterium]|nr:MAG: 50S ribosomal protein L15 [Bacteroidota bacterium]
MKLSNLKPAKGSVKVSKRIGRGTGSGRGGTSTKGHKGAQSRTGYKTKMGFEGGQMPLQRRIPKFGFTSLNKVYFKAINLDIIQKLVEDKKITDITFEVLYTNGLVSKNDTVKVLGRGELKSKVNVKLSAFSKSAIDTITKLGGTTEIV